MQMQIPVPDGVQSGQSIEFETPDGRVYGAVVPPNVAPGDSFVVEVEAAVPTLAAPSPAVAPTLQMEIPVPAGVNAGQVIEVQSPAGVQYSVEVPPGVEPGGSFIVEVATDDAGGTRAAPAPAPAAGVPDLPLPLVSSGQVEVEKAAAMSPEEAAAEVRARIQTANEVLAAEASEVPDLDLDLLKRSMERIEQQPTFGGAMDEPEFEKPNSGLELLSKMNELTGFKSTLPSFEDSLRKSPPRVTEVKTEEPAAPNAFMQKLQSMSSGASPSPPAADDGQRRRKSKYDM